MLRKGATAAPQVGKASALKKQLATGSSSADDFLLDQLQDLASDPFAVSLDDTPKEQAGRKRKRERDAPRGEVGDGGETEQRVEDKENQEPKLEAPKGKEAKPATVTSTRGCLIDCTTADTDVLLQLPVNGSATRVNPVVPGPIDSTASVKSGVEPTATDDDAFWFAVAEHQEPQQPSVNGGTTRNFTLDTKKKFDKAAVKEADNVMWFGGDHEDQQTETVLHLSLLYFLA